MKSFWVGMALLVTAVVIVLYSGLSVARVLTGSMVPWAVPGDLLITVNPRVYAPGIGNVVVARPYFTEGGDRLPPIAHRIIGGGPEGWETKGDANPEPDGWVVREVDKVVIAKFNKRIVPYASAGLAMFVVMALLWPSRYVDDDDIGPPPTGSPILYYWPPDA